MSGTGEEGGKSKKGETGKKDRGKGRDKRGFLHG